MLVEDDTEKPAKKKYTKKKSNSDDNAETVSLQFLFVTFILP